MSARSARFRLSTPLPLLALSLAALSAAACTTRDDDVLLVRAESVYVLNEPMVLRFVGRGDPDGARVGEILAAGFGAELLRTHAMTKRFVARAGDTRGDLPTYVAVGVRRDPKPTADTDRMLRAGPFGQRIPGVTPIFWTGEDALSDLVDGLGGAIVDLIAPGDTGPSHYCHPHSSYPLRDGYVAFLKVIAAEWRPAGRFDERAGLRATPNFTTVRANTAGDAEPARDLVSDPLVIATVLHRLAGSELARRMAPDDVYRPFLESSPPRGVPPALLLGAFRNFQAKLLAAWAGAVAAGNKPSDLVDLIETYAAAYPAERAEVTRIFLVTTYGATALPVAFDRHAPEDVLAPRLAMLTADILFGRRTLRAGM